MTKKPASGGASGGQGGMLSGQLAALRVQFHNRLQSDYQALAREHASALRSAPDRLARQRLLRLVHGLHGIAASFGYAKLGASAAAVEAIARKELDFETVRYGEALGPLVEALLTDLDAAIADG